MPGGGPSGILGTSTGTFSGTTHLLKEEEEEGATPSTLFPSPGKEFEEPICAEVSQFGLIDEAEEVAALLSGFLQATFGPADLKKLRDLQDYGRFSFEWCFAANDVLIFAAQNPAKWRKHGYYIPRGPKNLLQCPDLVETSIVAIVKDVIYSINYLQVTSDYSIEYWKDLLRVLNSDGRIPEHDYVSAKGLYPQRIMAAAGPAVHDEMQERNARLAKR